MKMGLLLRHSTVIRGALCIEEARRPSERLRSYRIASAAVSRHRDLGEARFGEDPSSWCAPDHTWKPSIAG